MAYGAIIASGGVAVAFWKTGATSTADVLVGYAMIGFGLLVAGMPFILWRRMLFAVRSGPLATARVTDLVYETSTRDTIDAISHPGRGLRASVDSDAAARLSGVEPGCCCGQR